MASERIQRRIGALLDEAEAAFAARDWPRVHEAARTALSLVPGHEDAEAFLLAAARNLGVAAGVSPGEALSQDTPSREAASRPPVNRSERAARRSLIGREVELEGLRIKLEEAIRGRGGLVLLAGEPGIGKTRLAEELAVHAEARGADVLWGRCHEGEGRRPYWPWVQVVRGRLSRLDEEMLRSDMGPGAAEIAEVVPEVRDRLPGLPVPPALAPAAARFRLFDSITAFTRSTARRLPLLIVLEDLHWTDRPSALLLLSIAREVSTSHVLVVATYRDEELESSHPLGQVLAELAREQLADRMTLGGLEKDDVGRLIEEASGTPADPDLTDAVCRKTDGNPFFVNEVVQLLRREGRFAGGGGSDPAGRSFAIAIPDGVRAVIGRRLERLSTACNRALSVAAAIGREFDASTVERVSGLEDERLLGLMEEAVGARILTEAEGAPDRYGFAHALVREVIYDRISAGRRARLHQQVAEALEAVYGDRAAEHAAELAYHYSRALAGAANVKLVVFAGAAGRLAVAGHAWEDAVHQFRAALGAAEGAVSEDLQADLKCQLGEALMAINEPREAWPYLVQAFRYYVRVRNVAGTLRAVEGLARAAFVGGPQVKVIEEALVVMEEGSLASAQLQAHLGYALGMAGDEAGAREVLERALATAREHGDRETEATLLSSIGHVEVWYTRLEPAIAAFQEVISLTGRTGVRRSIFDAHFTVAFSMIQTGQLEAAEEHVRAALTLAQELRDGPSRRQAQYLAALRAECRGDWDAGREAVEVGLRLSLDVRLIATAAIMAAACGDFAEAGRRQRELEDAVETQLYGLGLMFVSRALAYGASMSGSLEAAARAVRAAERALDLEARLAWNTPSNAGWLHQCLGLAAAVLGEPETAEREYAALAPFAGWLDTHRIRGLLALGLGRTEEALAHFQAALEFARPGYRFYYALAACDSAGVLLRRDRPDDRRRGLALLDEALGLARELGLRPVLDRCLELLEADMTEPGDAGANRDSLKAVAEAGPPWPGLAGRLALAEAFAAPHRPLGRAGEAFRAAIDEFRDRGMPFHEARALHLWGRALARAGRRNGGGAAERLDAAVAIYRKEGVAPRWIDGVERDGRVPGRGAGDACAYPDGLTPREVEVLRLVAAGATSREAGERLVLSVRTVERHLTNVYSKTGTHNRVQVAAYAAAKGLVPPAVGIAGGVAGTVLPARST